MSRHECGHVWVCSTITTSPPITIYLGTEMETVAFEKRFWRIRGSWRRWIRRYQSPRVILATANRWRRCQKAKRGTEILHKHAAWSYGLQQQGTSWCRTYASWDGTDAKILSALSRGRWWRGSALKYAASAAAPAGSERGEWRWLEEKRWTEDGRAAKQQKSQTWRDGLGKSVVFWKAPRGLQLRPTHISAQDKPITTWLAKLFVDLLSVCLSFSITDRETGRRPCFCLCETPEVKPPRQEELTNLFRIWWRWHTCLRVPGSLFTQATHGGVFFPFDPEWSLCVSVSIIKLSLALFVYRSVCQGDRRVTCCYQLHGYARIPPPDASTLRQERAPSHCCRRPHAAAGLFSLCSLLFFSGLLCSGFHSPPLDLSALSWSSVCLIYLHIFGCMSEPHLQNIVPNLQ